MQPKKTWTFESSSNPNKVYETQLHDDDSITCNCPGWTKRSIRSCKHTRMVETGIADQYAKAVWTTQDVTVISVSRTPAQPVDRQAQTNLKKLEKIKKQLKKEKPAPTRFVNWG